MAGTPVAILDHGITLTTEIVWSWCCESQNLSNFSCLKLGLLAPSIASYSLNQRCILGFRLTVENSHCVRVSRESHSSNRLPFFLKTVSVAWNKDYNKNILLKVYFTTHVNQTIMVYALNLFSDICLLFLNKTGQKIYKM